LNALLTLGGPQILLNVIKESMEDLIDITAHCLSILWQIASQTEFQSKQWLTTDSIQILFFVHPLFVPDE
jgi:hypothetical protein